MNEQDYWIDVTNRNSNAIDMEHQSKMSRLVQQEEFSLIEQLKPKFSIDGNQFCVMYGDNPMEGVCGFGDTPYLAVLDFNRNWHLPINSKTAR